MLAVVCSFTHSLLSLLCPTHPPNLHTFASPAQPSYRKQSQTQTLLNCPSSGSPFSTTISCPSCLTRHSSSSSSSSSSLLLLFFPLRAGQVACPPLAINLLSLSVNVATCFHQQWEPVGLFFDLRKAGLFTGY